MVETIPLDEVSGVPLDPDPFTIGLMIFGSISGGAAFLEARRQRQTTEQRQRDSFRAAWFKARRTLIFFKRSVDEFETYMLEDGYGNKAFRIGAVRVSVDFRRSRSMRRLTGQAALTANHMANDIDDVSEFLGEEDQEAIDGILLQLSEITIPERYSDVIRIAREVVQVYAAFLDQIGEREGFELGTDQQG